MHCNLLKTAMIAAALMLPTQAMAESRICVANLNWVAMTPEGNMVVSLQGMGQATLCNVNGTINTARGPVGSETCKGWYAGFTTAYARNATVGLWFDFGASAAPQCNALGFDWSVPANYPYFLTFS